ncbi:MAG: hypothetical protein EOM90_07600 [Alphaproteobacteria bacterium]|nr:hypothetical protein [Alphaproteobacteria bacterium]
MAELDILKELIKDDSIVPLHICKDANKGTIELIEPDCPTSKVTIYGVPPESIVIKVDNFRSPNSIFAGTKSECKRADYVIILDCARKKRILYIEMKKTKDSERHIIAQLKGAVCFIDYCKSIAYLFWGERNFLNGFEPRFVSFAHTGIPKKPTRVICDHPVHDTPERMKKIHSPNKPQFNHIIGA